MLTFYLIRTVTKTLFVNKALSRKYKTLLRKLKNKTFIWLNVHFIYDYLKIYILIIHSILTDLISQNYQNVVKNFKSKATFIKITRTGGYQINVLGEKRLNIGNRHPLPPFDQAKYVIWLIKIDLFMNASKLT